MIYLRNSWYMAAWADEVATGAPLVRTILDEPVLLARDAAGLPWALLDRCPHRFAPLSKGCVVDRTATCGYHGLAFDAGGACVANPHGPVTRSLAVRSYPVAEAHRAIWIWMGEPARADPTTIRDLAFLTAAPPTAFNKGYVLGGGNYQLFVDNILDLSHTDYLHPETLGGGAITRSKAKVDARADGVIAVHWHTFDDVPAPLVATRLPAGVALVDGWTEVEWSAPGVMTLVNGAVPAGASREGAGNAINVHIMTPATTTTTHYFFASTRDFRLDDAALNEEIRAIRAHIFSTEDEPMIAAQQARIGDRDFWTLRPALLKIDEGAVTVRRRMEALIAAEARGPTDSGVSA